MSPGVQKGKKHAPGAGRPRHFSPNAVRLSITIEPEHAAMLRESFGSVSEGIRAMIEELGKDRRPTKRQGLEKVAQATARNGPTRRGTPKSRTQKATP